MKILKNSIKFIFFTLLVILLFCFFSRLLCPKYMTNLVEGSFIREYYSDSKNHDVIFIGDCEMYSNISPMEIYEKEGITSFVRATPNQLMWQSYSIIEETLTYETPKVIVLSVNSMKFGVPESEEYNRLTIDEMKWSKQKVDIIKSSMTKNESFLSYVFPLFRYHSRWKYLSKEDITFLFNKENTTYNGYYMVKDIKPVENLPTKKKLTNYTFSDRCYEYLDKITKICKENNVELLLIKAPSIYPYWYEEYDKQLENYAKNNNLEYINFQNYIDDIGLDFNVDTYDSGMHLNLTGAQKFSKYFANLLKMKYNLTDYRKNETINQIYTKKLDNYHKSISNLN